MPNLRLTSFALSLAALLTGCGSTGAPGTFGGLGTGTLLATAQTAVQTLFTEPEAGTTPLMDVIRNAKRTVDVEVYMFTDKSLMQGLTDAKSRGVRVRVLMEHDPFNPGNPSNPLPTNYATAKYFKEVGISYRWTSKDFTYTHEKAMVVDGTTAVITTSNFTKSAFANNREYGVVDRDPSDAAAVQQIFDADWEKKPVNVSDPDLVVSPTHSRDRLTDLISSARKSILIEDEVAGDPAIFSLLGQKARSGVDVKVLLAKFSSGNTNAEEKRQLNAAGVSQVRFFSKPTLHAKLVIVDGRRAYLGSINLTTNSMDNNRELGLITDDRAIVGSTAATAASDWAGGTQ